MELRHIKTLLMVASLRSISIASKQLHLSQPSVTRIIQELEEDIGVPLFSRTKEGMLLTAAGKNFYRYATRIVSTLHEALSEVKPDESKPIINIGFCSSVFVFDLIEQLRNCDYDIRRLRFHELDPEKQIRSLRSNSIDISIARYSTEDSIEDFEQQLLFKAELFAVLPASHRLSGKKIICLSELRAESFVALQEETFGWYSANISALCRLAGFSPNIGFRANGLVAALAAISCGTGVGLFPRNIVNSIVPGYVYIPLCGSNNIDIACTLRKNENRKDIYELIDIIKKRYADRCTV